MLISLIFLPLVGAFTPTPFSTCTFSARTPVTSLALFHENFHIQSTTSLILADKNIPLEDSFSDEIDFLGDSTVQLLFVGFGVVVVLAILAKFFLNQMDAAIEKVLVDFESTMKRKYESRWVSIEAKLEGLGEPERSQKLFEIMEGLQQTEPMFMEKVNRDMNMAS